MGFVAYSRNSVCCSRPCLEPGTARSALSPTERVSTPILSTITEAGVPRLPDTVVTVLLATIRRALTLRQGVEKPPIGEPRPIPQFGT
jgi:N-acyl-L-homoserine lactone synthetase